MKKLLIISAWLATLCASMGQAVVNRDRLSLLRDVSLGSLTTGRPLVYDGSKWVNTTLGWSALSGTPTTLAGYGITDAFDLHSPGAIGDVTPGTGAFTGLTASGSAGTLLHVFNSAVGHDVLGVDSNGVLTGGNILVQGVYAQTGVSATQIRLGVDPQGSAPDVYLLRAAANALSLRNGTNGQTLDISRTFTDASNYSQLAIDVTGSTVAFSADEAGTGVGTLTGYSFDRGIRITNPANSGEFLDVKVDFNTAMFGTDSGGSMSFDSGVLRLNNSGVLVAYLASGFLLLKGDEHLGWAVPGGGADFPADSGIKRAPSGGGVQVTDGGAGTGVIYTKLPTSNPGPGILWNNAGTPAIGF